MPFKSKAQVRLFYAKNRRGEISDKDLEKWKSETPSIKALPERRKKRKTHEKVASLVQGFVRTASCMAGSKEVGCAVRESELRRHGGCDGDGSEGAQGSCGGCSSASRDASAGHDGFDRGFGRARVLPEAGGGSGGGAAKVAAREGNLVDEAEEEENGKDFTHTVKGSQLKKETGQSASMRREREGSVERREFPQSMRHNWRSSRG